MWIFFFNFWDLREDFGESAELVKNSPTPPSPIYWPLGVDRRQGKTMPPPPFITVLEDTSHCGEVKWIAEPQFRSNYAVHIFLLSVRSILYSICTFFFWLLIFTRQVEFIQKSVKCRPNKKGLHETQGAGNKWNHYLYSTQCLHMYSVCTLYIRSTP